MTVEKIFLATVSLILSCSPPETFELGKDTGLKLPRYLDAGVDAALEIPDTGTDLLEDLDAGVDAALEIPDTGTNLDAGVDHCKQRLLSWACLPCFDCNPCRDDPSACNGRIGFYHGCPGYEFFIPDIYQPGCDGFICCDQLESK